MTKQNISATLVLVALFASMPGTAWALPVSPTMPDIKIEKPVVKLPADLTLPEGNAFCQSFDATEKNLSDRVKREREKVDSYLAELAEETENARNESDAKLEERRSVDDQKRSEVYLALEEQASGDTEEDAVEEFRDTVEDAVETRRAAVDSARATYRAGVDALLATRKKEMETARDTFQQAIDAALTKAKGQCDDTLSSATIRKTFQTNLKNARTKLMNDKASLTKIEGSLAALQATRNESIQSALDVFEKSLSQAQAELKQAFDEETS